METESIKELCRKGGSLDKKKNCLGIIAPCMYPCVAHDQLDSPVLLKEDINYVDLHGVFLIVIPFKLDRVFICDPTEQWVSKVRLDSEPMSNSPVILIATPKLWILTRIPVHKYKRIDTFCQCLFNRMFNDCSA